VRHRVAGRVLNADTQHRLAMRRNLARSLFLHGRVVTTTAKAKATRPFAEKLVTRAKRAVAAKAAGDEAAWLHQVRVLARDVPEKAVLRRLVSEIAPLFEKRPGGYTRIVRDWKNQVGDNAPRSVFELVEKPVPPEEAAAAAETEAAAGAQGGPPAGKAPAGKAKKKPAKAAKPATKGKAKSED
jgi:large subunit ribosomal protein L17